LARYFGFPFYTCCWSPNFKVNEDRGPYFPSPPPPSPPILSCCGGAGTAICVARGPVAVHPASSNAITSNTWCLLDFLTDRLRRVRAIPIVIDPGFA
jgi:hypothetical protein